ncbi:hypothetical protein BED47_18470 [Gottfriedia luciferensis]|uniref:Uncharacterized protein n=1 Tax=Gottfriedia luciferensis TaxID=178774 RepID=A0ABX2ZW64_9BACI|nr:hypothetical protein [Gottfriedia luciferensis]ODG92669.1 hypothetical protein BED47_18470 [Gottfriedia luciferensis]
MVLKRIGKWIEIVCIVGCFTFSISSVAFGSTIKKEQTDFGERTIIESTVGEFSHMDGLDVRVEKIAV